MVHLLGKSIFFSMLHGLSRWQTCAHLVRMGRGHIICTFHHCNAVPACHVCLHPNCVIEKNICLSSPFFTLLLFTRHLASSPDSFALVRWLATSLLSSIQLYILLIVNHFAPLSVRIFPLYIPKPSASGFTADQVGFSCKVSFISFTAAKRSSSCRRMLSPPRPICQPLHLKSQAAARQSPQPQSIYTRTYKPFLLHRFVPSIFLRSVLWKAILH